MLTAQIHDSVFFKISRPVSYILPEISYKVLQQEVNPTIYTKQRNTKGAKTIKKSSDSIKSSSKLTSSKVTDTQFLFFIKIF